jgi:hypothetical protein
MRLLKVHTDIGCYTDGGHQLIGRAQMFKSAAELFIKSEQLERGINFDSIIVKVNQLFPVYRAGEFGS